MEGDDENAAWQAFADAVGMWRTSSSGAVRDLVDSATELLVVGFDTPHLRELAGASAAESMWVIEPLVHATIDELDAGRLLEGSPERASLQAMLRRYLQRRIALRDLSSWAHVAIGHEGEGALQPFVELDDIYDDWEYSGFDLGELDRVARTAANEFLSTGETEAFNQLGSDAPHALAPTPPKRPWWRLRR